MSVKTLVARVARSLSLSCFSTVPRLRPLSDASTEVIMCRKCSARRTRTIGLRTGSES
jgi:hypothetical protein